jgi:hypothetical protein
MADLKRRLEKLETAAEARDVNSRPEVQIRYMQEDEHVTQEHAGQDGAPAKNKIEVTITRKLPGIFDAICRAEAESRSVASAPES